MHNAFTKAHPFAEENGVAPISAAPRPSTLAAQESIDLIPKLLLSFPVPRMVSQLHLETVWPSEDDDSHAAAAADATATVAQSGEWSAEDLDDVVCGMQQSAQHLLLTGSYTHFLQEQFHYEVAPYHSQASGAVISSSDPTTAPARVACYVSAAVAPGMRKLLTCMGQQGTVLNVPLLRKIQEEMPRPKAASASASEASMRHRVPLTRIPKTEKWVRSYEESSTRLQPRCSVGLNGAWVNASSESLDSAVEGGSATAGAAVFTSASMRRGGTVETTSSSAAAVCAVGGYEPQTRTAEMGLEALYSTVQYECRTADSFAEWVRRQQSARSVEVPVSALLHVISTLPLQLHPFDGIEQELLSSFLASLADEKATADDSNALQWSTRGLLCCQCLAHPHLPTEAVPDGLVSCIINVFGRVVHDVSTHLLMEQQWSGDSALEAQDIKEDGGRRRSLAVNKRGGSSNGSVTASRGSGLLPLLEQLRGFIGGFALILCNPNLRLVVDTDVLRLEELCRQCLFRLTRTCTKELHTLYSTYVADIAVQLYRCIWNRLDVQRQRTAESFFQQLPLCESLTQRTYNTHVGGRVVLPLTVAMLAAAQSMPLPHDAIGAASAETLQRQCSVWANCFVRKLIHNAGMEREKTEDAIAGTTAICVAEDLVELLSVPEWPGADLLLRSIVMGLAQLTLGSDAALSTPAEALRPLAIDVLGHVTVKLFDAQRFPVAAAIVTEMERVGESASTSQAAARLALRRVLPSISPLQADDQLAWGRLCGSVTDDSGEVGVESDQFLRDLVAAVYMAESRLIASSSMGADYAAVWFHIRAARLMTWVCLHDSPEPEFIPLAALDGLVQWRRPSGSSSGISTTNGGQPTNWDDVCAWTQAISTQLSKSMLSLRMRHVLVSMLFSVFHVKDAQGASVAMTDLVQKKTLVHLARLTALHPPLHRFLWPIVRQCVRDDSARVRESIVPLLLALLGDAADTEGNADGPVTTITVTGHLPALTAESIAAEVISSLLHLLGDKSVAVVSRTITALDTFLTDQSYHYLFATPQGAALLSFIQQRLLCFAGPTAEPKHRLEVVRHFLHRWVVTFADSDVSITGAHAQLANELVALTVKCGAPEFPYEVTDEHPLVQMLQHMYTNVQAQNLMATSSKSAGASANAATAGSSAVASHHKRRSRGYHVDADQLLHIMRCAAQSLWMRYQCFHSADDAVACLAALQVLTLARNDWVMPLTEVLVQSLAYPPPTTSPLASSPEALGGSLLQLCQILHSVLQAPKLPLISLDYLARCLTTLLSKYVGPYQQRVIVASCGTLCALITCGAKHRLSAQVNVPYLQLCYSLMNTYYCRVRTLLPTLAMHPQSVAYTQRFLFLLSEFLRNYPGWRQSPPHPALLGDAVGISSNGYGPLSGNSLTALPNQLAKGPGIAANSYQLVEDVLHSCGTARERVAVIALRVIASLCMLDPTTYFYRAETHIRAALASPDHNLQLQGLLLLSDFLKEEDERVDAASRNATRLDTTALILGRHKSASRSRSGSRSSDDDKSVKRTPKTTGRCTRIPTETRRGRKPKQAQEEESTAAAPPMRKELSKAKSVTAPESTEDFNSGMSTWIFQQFHADIARLSCSSPHVPVRSQCLRLFQQAAQGGLLPPDRYVRVIIALAADVHAPLRQQAAVNLITHCDRHEEVVTASVSRGVALAFDLHHACGVHLLRSAVVTPASLANPPGTLSHHSGSGSGGEQSVHGALYRLLHKRSRDNMITTLVHFFYQDGKVSHWCEEHAEELAVWATPQTAVAAAIASAPSVGTFGVVHPLIFLCHLTLVLFTLPFQHESDVMHVLQQCRVALDLNGQSALDWLKNSPIDVIIGSEPGVVVSRWKAVGSILLYYLRRALLTEYRLTLNKVQRYGTRERRSAGVSIISNNSGPASAPLRRLDSVQQGTESASSLMKHLETLIEKMEPALVAPHSKEGNEGHKAAWQYVSIELEAALLNETAEESGRTGAFTTLMGRDSRKTRRGGGEGHKDEVAQLSRKAAKRSAVAKRKRARSLSSERLSSDADCSEEESMLGSTESRSISVARSASSPSSSATSLASVSTGTHEASDDGVV